MQDFKNGIKSVGKTALSMATNVGIDLLIGGAINLGAWGIDKIVNAQSDAIERGNKALEDYNNLNQKLSTSTAWVNTNSERYAELAKGVSYLGENIKLTSADYEEYQQLSQQIAQQFPELITGYNSMGQPIIGTAKSVEDLNQALKDQKYTEYSKSLKQAGDVADKFYEEIFRDKNWAWQEAGAQKQLDALNDFRESYNDAIATTGKDKYAKLFSLSNFQMDNNFIDALDTAGVSLGDFLDLTNELLQSEGNLETDSPALKTLNSIMTSSVDLQSQIDQSTDTMRNYLPAFIKANKQYQDLAFENPELETQITALTRGFSLEDMVSRNFFDKDNGIQNIKKWANDAVSELSNSEMQQVLTDVFTINDDASQKSFGQWRREADDALDKAATKSESLTGAWGREQMRQASGIADKYERLSKIQDDISARWEDESFGWDARNNLSMEDFETLGSIAIDDSFTGSYKEAVNQIATLQREAQLSVSGIQKHVTDAQTTLAAVSSAITESASDTGASAESITAVEQAFSEFENLNPALLFKSTAKGVKANTKAMAGLVDLQHKMKAQDFSDAIKNQTKAIAEQNEVVKQASEENKGLEQDRLKSMFGDLYSLQQARSQFNALYQQQRKLFSDYGEWVNASSTENAGDPFLNMVSGLKEAKDAWDKGLIGTDDFKSFAKMISPTGATDDKNFAENYAKAERYLTEDVSGMKNFLNDLESKGLAEYNAQTEEWAYNIGNVADAAKKMGMGKDFMTNMFGRLEDYGSHNNIIADTEDGVLKLSDAYTNLAESQAKLEQLKKEDPGNTTAIDAAEKEVAGYQRDVQELGTNLSEIASDSADAYNQEIDSAKSQIAILGKEYENVLKNNLYGDNQNAILQHLKSTADGLASLYGVESFDVTGAENNAKAYQEALQSATIEKPAEIDFGDDTEKAENYASAVGKIQEANKENNQTLSQATETLKQFNSEQIKGINLFDGAYDSDELKPAEQALDQLGTELGLTAEEMALLPQVLEAMGIIKPETDNSDIDETNEKLDKTKESVGNLQNMEGSSFDLNVDVTGEENVEQAKEIVSTMPPNTSANVHVEVDGEEDTERTIDLINSAPKNQNSVLTVTVAGDDPEEIERIMTAADEANANGANVVVKVEGQLGDIDTSTAEVTDKEVELLGKVSHIDTTGDYQPVALKGNVVQIDTTGSYQSVALKGNIVQLEGTPSDPVNVVGNITEVTGGEGKTIEVIGHIATVTGGNGKMINVIGNITSVTGGDATSGTINYEKGNVEKADGTVSTGIINYKKGDVEKADGTVSTGTINYNLGTVADAGSPVATGTINYKLGSVAKPGGATVTGTMASGTMFSSAYANGTAYNVLNMHPLTSANALGNVTVPRDQVSLTNEVGQESIVRNGVWSLLPGGAHLEHLKKGDIVFNASQTKALLEHGRMSGHARAYADGTLSTQTGNYYGLYKAFDRGSGFVGFGGGLSGSGKPSGNSSSTKPNTNAQNANTNATRSNTNATNDNTEAAKKSTQVFDWVARKLEYFANKTKAIADTITDWVSSATKKNLLYKQIKATDDEMHVNYNAAQTYYKKARAVGLDEKTRKLVEQGKYSIEDIDTSTEAGKKKYEKIQDYAKYYDEYQKCIDAVRELRKEQVELFAQWAAMPTEEAEKKIDKLTQSYNGLTAIQSRLETASMGGSAQAALMEQLEITYKTALGNKKYSDRKVSEAKTAKDNANKNLQSAKKKETLSDMNLVATARKIESGKGFSKAEKERVRKGQSLSTKGLKGNKKKLVEQYNAELKKRNQNRNAVKSAQSKVDKATSAYNSANSGKKLHDAIYDEYKKNYEEAKKAYDAGDPISYQNYLVEAELANLKQQNEAKQTAYRETTKNTQTATKKKDSAKSKVDSVKKSGTSLAKKYAKHLTAAQEKQLKEGKKVTGSIKDKKTLAAIEKYNRDLQNAMNSYTAATQQLTAAQEAEAEAAENAAQSQAEYAKAQIEAEQKKFENIEKYYEKRIDYQKALSESQEQERELSKAHGNYTESSGFDEQIKTAQEAQKLQEEAVKKMQEQLDKSVKSGVIKENSDEWLDMKSQIVEAENAVGDYNTQIEQLKQEQLTVKYEEMFDRAIEKAEKFKDKLGEINSLITEEMMYDYDTGHLTEFGALSIVLNAKQLDTSLTTLKDYVKKRQQIMDDFKADKFGQETYDKLMSENDSSLQSALKNAQSYQQAILGIIKNQAKAEQDALFKVIDARKDALKKKKDYYEYDKTLKNKTKEIDLLKQQIAALDGVFAPRKLFNCGNVPITLFRYNRTGNGICECGMC